MGSKSLGCYETPAGTVLRKAHLEVEGITMDREVMRIRRYCYGFGYAPEMELIMNSVDFSQRNITGAIEINIIAGRESPCALYSADLACIHGY